MTIGWGHYMMDGKQYTVISKSQAEDIFEDTRVSNNINSMIELNDRRRKQQIMQKSNFSGKNDYNRIQKYLI